MKEEIDDRRNETKRADGTRGKGEALAKGFQCNLIWNADSDTRFRANGIKRERASHVESSLFKEESGGARG